MIDLNYINKIYISPGYTDLRLGIDGLATKVKNILKKDPFDNSLYLFCNTSRNKIKILHFEETGFWIYYKRFETGTIKWPKDELDLCITIQDFKYLLDGYIILQKPMPKCTARIVL